MRASILDLRYNMKNVLKALDRNEKVEVLYRGKLKAVLYPSRKEKRQKVIDHPFFGMLKKQNGDVEAQIDQLRSGRYDDL